MRLGELTLDDAAAQARGNWLKFDSFAWHDRPDNAEEWAIVYTHNRDSDLVAQSNASVIEKALALFLESDEPDVVSEHHGHWACGWIDGYAIRVYRNGEITPAFHAYYDLVASLEDYPVLDEEDLSRRESEASRESWDSWARREFERDLEKQFDGVEFDFPGGDTFWDFFSAMADRANEYWYADGSGMSIHMSRIVEQIDFDDVEEWATLYTVSWFDAGWESQAFYDESQADHRVKELRNAGHLEASYTVSTPVSAE